MKEKTEGTIKNRNGDASFEEFLLSEYQNIAQAHFNTISAISSFFRYYLILMALPMTLFSALLGLLQREENMVNVDFLGITLGFIFVCIAIVGLLVMIYIANLRMDAILYARTVNGIRKYFFDNAEIDLDTKLRIRVLPQTPSLPSYFEARFFLPVVTSFAILNSLYLFLSFVLFLKPLTFILKNGSVNISGIIKDIPLWGWGIILFFLICHILSYWGLARYREHSYLKSFAIGVDIDGVLGDHVQHFCNFLYNLCGKKIVPEQITSIPVHENENLNISKNEEEKIVNDPQYWIKMPCMKDAAETIKKLRNLFRLKIYLFTHRPWPTEGVKKSDEIKKWKRAVDDLLTYSSSNKHNISRRIRNFVIKTRMKISNQCLRLRPIDVITIHWLDSNKIQYDKLVIEKGSEEVSDPRGEFRNRFYISRKRKLRFFVEDDHRNAVKLAYICDIVFLINQPYNQSKNLPSNVIRVDSWNDIYRKIRNLL